MSTTRVLVIAPTPFFGDRGCHVRIYEQVKTLTTLGANALVVTYAAGDDVDVPIRRAPTVPGVGGRPLGPSLGRPLLDAALLVAAIKAVREFDPHILHCHLHEGVAIGSVLRLLFGRPVVADLQGSLAEELIDHGFLPVSGVLTVAVRSLEARLVRLPDHVLVSSSAGETWLRDQGVQPSRVSVLEDGVDLPSFPPTAPPPALVSRLGLGGKRVVVFLGVLTEYQGIDDLLSAAAEVTRQVPDSHFLVMGYPNENYYREKARAMGLEPVVTFPGRIPYHEAVEWLALGDVAVSPKQSLTEANGKLLTYMACRLPIVATDTPVNRDILGELGRYVPVGDSVALARSLVEILGDDATRVTLGQALRNRAETRFAWPALGRRLLDLYAGVRASARR